MRDDARSATRARKPIAAPAGASRGRARVLWVATLALGLAGAGVVGFLFASRAPRSTLHGLARAVAQYRAIKPRLSGQFRHAPCARDDSSRLVAGLICRDLSLPPSSLGGFAARFNDVTIADSGDAAHVRGVFGLFWPEQEGSLEQAIADLRAAADASPDRADVQSDLAAALLVLAEAAEDPASLVDAYLAADSAVALDGALPQARFNLALVLEWLYLYRDAEAAWRAYLEIDSRSRWAREARAHLERVRVPPPETGALLAELRDAVSRDDSAAVDDLVARIPWIARRETIERALTSWARALRGNKVLEADSALRFARVVAAALGRRTSNTLPEGAVAAIDSAMAVSDTSRLARLVAGQIALAEGTQYLHVQPVDLTAAAERLDDARELLGKARSPMADWATYRRAEVSYSIASDEQALDMLSSILNDSPINHSALRGRAAQVSGLIHDLRVDYEPAMSAYDAAIAAADLAREVELATRVRGWRSLLVLALRGRQAAWRDLYGALSATPSLFDEPRSRASVFRDVVREISTSAPELAVRFQGEVVRAARTETPADAVTALAQNAALLTAAREFARAARDIEEADRLARRVEEQGIRVPLLAVVDLARGQLGAAVDPEVGITALQRTLATYRATGEFFGRASANLYLADAYLARGNVDSAEAALGAAAGEMERRRNLVKGYRERVQFLDHARPVLDRILEFYANQRDPVVAFDFFERARARVLLERLEGRRPPGDGERVESRSGWQISALLPSQTALISYAVMDDELLTWVLSRHELRLVRTALPSSELEGLVRGLEQAILTRAGNAGSLPWSGALYDRIIRPVLHPIGPADRLIIVPDKSLHFVPFAALWDTASGEYLVERHEITVAPSALLVAASMRRGRVPRHQPRVLAVGNPAFDRRSFPLPNLPGAEAEAENIAQLYSTTQLIVGSAATTDNFLAQVRKADILHFAGHAVVRPGAPLLSHLVLAPGTQDQGALYAHDVFDLDLPGTELAILSGCHTSSGDLSSTEGVSSLARAFLAAGVQLVVASLWAVEDQRTAEFFGEFHRLVAAGQDPTAALRATHLAWIRSPNRRGDVRTWAAFQAFGGVGAPEPNRARSPARGNNGKPQTRPSH